MVLHFLAIRGTRENFSTDGDCGLVRSEQLSGQLPLLAGTVCGRNVRKITQIR